MWIGRSGGGRAGRREAKEGELVPLPPVSTAHPLCPADVHAAHSCQLAFQEIEVDAMTWFLLLIIFNCYCFVHVILGFVDSRVFFFLLYWECLTKKHILPNVLCFSGFFSLPLEKFTPYQLLCFLPRSCLGFCLICCWLKSLYRWHGSMDEKPIFTSVVSSVSFHDFLLLDPSPLSQVN